MNWMNDLTAGVKDAISRHGNVRVAVHSEAQQELGQRAAERLSPERASAITFEVIPEDEQDMYPIGVILA